MADFCPDNRSCADRKFRFGGILEVPVVSKFQRALLDAGRLKGLSQAMSAMEYGSLLDVGCGLGEASRISRGVYYGMDNSLPRIGYAAIRYPRHKFVSGHAMALPFRDEAFDAVMLIDTSHHLLDQQFLNALEEMKRVSRRYLIISDPVVTDGQSALSRFFYRLDRGACFRAAPSTKRLLETEAGLTVIGQHMFRTFPGLYLHAAFICRKA